MKKCLILMAALTLCVSVAWAGTTIKIPVASPYTGQLASFGEGVKNAALLKGEEINVIPRKPPQ